MSNRKGVVQFGRFTVTSPSGMGPVDPQARRSSLVTQGPMFEEENKEILGRRLGPGAEAGRESETGEKNGLYAGRGLVQQDVPMFTVSTTQLPDPPSLGKLPDVFTPKPQSSVAQTHSPKDSEPDEFRKVPISLISTLQETLCGRFSEMMDLHKSVMGDSIARDARRDEQMRMLADENLELVRTVTRLQMEHSHLRERVYGKDKPI